MKIKKTEEVNEKREKIHKTTTRLLKPQETFYNHPYNTYIQYIYM